MKRDQNSSGKVPTNTTLQKWNAASKVPPSWREQLFLNRAPGQSLKCANLQSKLWSCSFYWLAWWGWFSVNSFELVSIFKALPILRQETNSASKIGPKMKNLMVILIFIVSDFINVQVSSTQHWKLKLACWPLMVDLVIYALKVIFKQIETTYQHFHLLSLKAGNNHNCLTNIIVVDFWWSDFSGFPLIIPVYFIIPRIRSTLEINTLTFFYLLHEFFLRAVFREVMTHNMAAFGHFVDRFLSGFSLNVTPV